MVFNVKYLGMTLVGQPKGEDMAAAAIRRIVTTVSYHNHRAQWVIRPFETHFNVHY